jgi:4-aminobutyrate aminotransferase-like enzyme
MTSSIPLMNDGNVVANMSTPFKGHQHHEPTKGASAVLHRSLLQDPLHVISAKGHYLQLSNGQKIFDATGGAAVACIGHGDERYDEQHVGLFVLML